MTNHADRRESGFKAHTRVAAARDALLDAAPPHGRVERVPVADADGRALADAAAARRDVPHYDRAAMDGYAVRAADTLDARGHSPAVLDVVDGDVGPREAASVHTGSAVPAGADAVVMVEDTTRRDGRVEVAGPVAEGGNIDPAGSDVDAGGTVLDAGHRLRATDLGLLRAVGVREVSVVEKPTVAVVPTGDEVVAPDADPAPGEVVETNALTLTRLVDRWGGTARYRDVVPDDADALADALDRDADADLIVTTGGSSVGERDLIPDVVAERGDVLVHGVALKPGHPAGFGVVDDTPVLFLPGSPVAAVVNAQTFLRPALKRRGGLPLTDPPAVDARLAGKLRSEPGVRTFARVALDDAGSERVATPVSTSGASKLSTIARADGWVQIPESVEGVAAGDTVTVEDWEASL
ncbi:molybdopterin molybdotransferase MoeA [Halocalculus aciditolerans]|uniref:Molybdopterin molybdenumtransferase MoeA n=1 Tax=Halocalculus aciditolerans TaxID=1383812 RepID=A0A830FFV6_9EURY|nr:gephyrin-like molybdotransferase Glp [Halocalculus aciditolerans]GGL51250.1 molybdopterin molybdenumtransferase MoeA [Halocalculus aciditolerans]